VGGGAWRKGYLEENQRTDPVNSFVLSSSSSVCHCIPACLKEIPGMRKTVTSSLNEISSDHLKNRMVVRGGGVTPPDPSLFDSRLLDRYLKTTDMVYPPP
jgi:hypothetical protein